jgi:hypothetical protein
LPREKTTWEQFQKRDKRKFENKRKSRHFYEQLKKELLLRKNATVSSFSAKKGPLYFIAFNASLKID